MIRSMLYKNVSIASFTLTESQTVRWIIGQVQKQRHPLHTSILLEILGKEASCLQIHAHSPKNDREVILMVIMGALVHLLILDQTRLPTDLGGNLVVW